MSDIGIYKITSPTGKIYIGQTRRLHKRLTSYERLDCKTQTKLYNSLKFYGWEAHKFEIIHELPNDVDPLIIDGYEVLYWQLYKDCGVEMLNCRKPARNNIKTEDVKKKISNSNKGKNLGRKASEETRRKISLSLMGKTTGRKHTEEAKAKMRAAHDNPDYDYSHHFGVNPSVETRLKMSLAKKGKPNPHKQIAVIQLDLKGNFIKEWSSIQEARDALNTKSSIGDVCSGKRKTACKFKWKYKN